MAENIPRTDEGILRLVRRETPFNQEMFEAVITGVCSGQCHSREMINEDEIVSDAFAIYDTITIELYKRMKEKAGFYVPDWKNR